MLELHKILSLYCEKGRLQHFQCGSWRRRKDLQLLNNTMYIKLKFLYLRWLSELRPLEWKPSKEGRERRALCTTANPSNALTQEEDMWWELDHIEGDILSFFDAEPERDFWENVLQGVGSESLCSVDASILTDSRCRPSNSWCLGTNSCEL